MVGSPGLRKAIKRKIQASAEKASMKTLAQYRFYEPVIPNEYGFTSSLPEYPPMFAEMSGYPSYCYVNTIPQQAPYWIPPTRSDFVKMELRNSLQARQLATQQPYNPSGCGMFSQPAETQGPASKMRVMIDQQGQSQHQMGCRGVQAVASDNFTNFNHSSIHSSPSAQSLFDDIFDDIPIGREDKDGAETPEQLYCSFDWNLGAGEFEFDCANMETRLFVNTVLSIS